MKYTVTALCLVLFGLNLQSQVNIAVNKSVTVDSEISSQPAWKAVDGYNYSNINRWVSDNNGYPHWIEVDLEQEYQVTGINFYTGLYGDNHPVYEYHLQSWSGTAWVDITHVSGNLSPVHKPQFEPVVTSQIRLEAITGEGDALMLYEIEVFARLNLAPSLDPVENADPIYSDEGTQSVILTGITDGDTSSVQNLTIVALSSNQSIVANPVIQYSQGDSTAHLEWIPAGPEGSATITVSISDDGGDEYGGSDTGSVQFNVFVRDPEKNYAPTLDQLPDIYAFSSGESYVVNLKGITDGDKNKEQALELWAVSVDNALIENLNIFYIQGSPVGKLQFNTTAANGTGTITIKVKDAGGTADNGTDSTLVSFKVITTLKENAVQITTDLQTQHQVIEGFGGFGLEKVDWSRGPYYSQEYIEDIVEDLGSNIVRISISSVGFEPINDNSDPYDTDLELFRNNIYKYEDWKFLDFVRDLHTAHEEVKFIASSWSPPAWMKSNNNVSEGGYLLPINYEEYAEYIVAFIKLFRQETGADLYAVSLQNEPTFWEPYASCRYTPRTYCDLIRVVGERFELEGISTKLFYPEEVMVREADMAGWMNTLNNDEYARKYVDIVAVHGYERTGTSAGEIGGALWEKYYNDYVNFPGYPKQFWMTETSGQQNTHEGAIRLVSGMSNAIRYGRLNAWVYWTFSGEAPDPYNPSNVYNLMLNGVKLKKFYASKNYYRYVRPGARAIESNSTDIDVMVNAFWHEVDNSLTYVLINKSGHEKVTNFDTYSMATDTRLYRTSETEDCKEVVIPSGSEVYLLPPMSVSTFVLSGGEYNNHPPTIETVKDSVLIGSPDSLAIILHGITDGDPDKEQEMEISTEFSNSAVINHLTLEEYTGTDSALLILYFNKDVSGENITTVQLTENDPNNLNQFMPVTKMYFSTWVVNYINNPPSFNELDTAYIELSEGQQGIELTGVNDGNEEAEEAIDVGFWAVHDRYFDIDSIVFTQGDSSIYLWVTPKRKGASVVKVNLTDNGETFIGDNYFEDRFFIKVLDFGVSSKNSLNPGSILYPNPADHHLSITGADNFKQYQVFNQAGRQMVAQVIKESTLSLATENFPPGIYYIKLTGIDSLKVYKFVIMH